MRVTSPNSSTSSITTPRAVTLAKAREAKRNATGRCEGRKPFGRSEEEQAILREMRRLRRANPKTGKRRSFARIAEELNERGMTRSGKPLAPSSVRYILQG